MYIAAFLRDSTVRRILTSSLLEFFVPRFLFEELDVHLGELTSRAGLSDREVRRLRGRFDAYLTVIPAETLRPHMGPALRIMADVDREDAPYIAAALAVDCDGLWSDDPHLKRQSAVPCWTTKELVAALHAEGFDVNR